MLASRGKRERKKKKKKKEKREVYCQPRAKRKPKESVPAIKI